MNTSPTLVTPVLGVASATSLATSAASPLLLTNGQLTTIALTSQTIGATTLTIPDFASVSDTFVFNTKAATLSNKTFVAPALGTPASGVATNLTGTAAGLTAGNVTTNANLTGPITSVGNATSVAAQTGTGTTFVMNPPRTWVTPDIGVATEISLATSAQNIFTAVAGTAPVVARSATATDDDLKFLPFTGGAGRFAGIFTSVDLTADRTYTFPDVTGTLVTGGGTASGTNTGDQTITLTGGVTGSGTGSFAATVITNANLTGPITSVGNATAIASQTGTGTTFVMNTSPTLVTPVLGVATGTSLATSAQNIFSATAGTAPLVARSATATDDDLRLLPFAGGAGRFAGILTSADLTADRTFILPDVTGTLVTGGGTASGTNTGDQTITLTGGVTGSGTGSFAATVITNANLTGPITSVGNATAIASQTGTGTTFVMNTSPTLVTPVLGVATGTSLATSAQNIFSA